MRIPISTLIVSLFALSSLQAQSPTPVPTGNFPRIGNVFHGETLFTASPTEAEQTQLFLGGDFTNSAAQTIRTAAPDTPLLVRVNATETVLGTPVVPDQSYYLKDTKGNNIQTWPGNPGDFLLNLTLPKVQQFLAQFAYQQMTQTGFVYDGVFFDNVNTMISDTTTDVYGNPIQISSQNNGIADLPGPLDAAWSAGLYAMIADFKALAPNGYASGHINQTPPDPRSLAVFNGDSFVFDAVYVTEGTMAFGTLFDSYQTWFAQGQKPVITAMQSSPPSQLAYGYGYYPLTAALPQTITWGQDYYPNMRFGLAMALMNNGFSIFDLGDSSAGTAWWYDEYNFNLGQPVTPATLLGTPQSANDLVNPGFEGSLAPWLFKLTSDGSAAATAGLDTTTFVNGYSSAHVDVTSAATINWHIDLEQDNLPITAGAEYQVQFWAKADSPVSIQLFTEGGAPAFTFYGLNANVTLSTNWQQYSVSFVAPVSASDCKLGFFFGNSVGNYWLDGVQMTQSPVRVYRRDFTNGVTLLNGTSQTQTISLESGLAHFSGSQAPKHQYIVDDSSAGFTTTGSWAVDTFDTGLKMANPPYYHAWKSTCHEMDTGAGSAQWNLAIPASGQYTLQVWLPAAPAASTWTKSAVYTVMAGAQVLGTTTLDQSQAAGGDQWYTIFTNVNLTAGTTVLQVTNGGNGPLIADAVSISSASKLNDGSAATSVTLQPFDGVLLQRKTPNQTITFAPLANLNLTPTPFAISASASSGLPVTFVSDTTSVCTVSGSTVTLLVPGTCSIVASQKGNGSFTAAVPVTQSFTVAPVTPTAQTINFGAIASQYLNGTITLSATASSGLPVSFFSSTTSVCSVTLNTAVMLTVGTCSVTALQPGSAFYAPATFVTQSFQVVAGPPAVVSVTPNAGTGTSQTFAAKFSDPNQGTDLSALLMLINTSTSGANACYIEYYASSNLIYLKNNANSGFVGSITPGTNTSLSNSQCTVSGSGSSYVTAGTTATLSLALTFSGTGLENVYLMGTEKNGSSTGWVQAGTWGAPPAGTPAVVSVSPSSGTGTSQTFTGNFTDTAGGPSLGSMYMLFNTSLSGTNACYIEYFVVGNIIELKNNANTGYVGSITPGSSGSLSNSQCTVYGTGSSYSTGGTSGTLNLNITFASTSPVLTYLYAADRSGANTGWVQAGTWGTTVPAKPSVVSVSPSSGSGASQTFTGTFSDTDGAAYLSAMYMLFNTSLSGTNACYVEYFVSSNTIELKNNANTGFVGSITPGTNTSLSNSQCTVYGTGSSYTTAGANGILSLNVTFAGTAGLSSYLYASDKSGANTGWVLGGSWTP